MVGGGRETSAKLSVEAPREAQKEGDGRGARVENSLRPQWQPVQRKSLTEITRNIHILSPPHTHPMLIITIVNPRLQSIC